ncbi:hypothetical protein PRIPAC_75027 [Pristionchus pacificus]|uniref:Uncharacterized protein n=1 Tax=Pristionchus pacificus TaxID=54126 RepID=A0A2A6C8V7_PRIPA|nr:hypothetical protein PRIPAC_75027 [Pristionchus pacificus]|eukprot:PDM74530.1 hypothetical protein PRIPAC_41886 [Pristionchus pacificus]
MLSGRCHVAAARVLQRISARSNSLHVGPNVQLRRCDKQPLENVNVTVLHNGARAVAISRELVARGARVTHFVKEGSEVPDVEGQGVYVNLDCESSRGRSTILPYSSTRRSELVASLKGADVFVDSSTKGVGMAPKDVLKINARLIYSSVQADSSDAASWRALADIACALYGREKTSVGQIL